MFGIGDNESYGRIFNHGDGNSMNQSFGQGQDRVIIIIIFFDFTIENGK